MTRRNVWLAAALGVAILATQPASARPTASEAERAFRGIAAMIIESYRAPHLAENAIFADMAAAIQDHLDNDFSAAMRRYEQILEQRQDYAQTLGDRWPDWETNLHLQILLCKEALARPVEAVEDFRLIEHRLAAMLDVAMLRPAAPQYRLTSAFYYETVGRAMEASSQSADAIRIFDIASRLGSTEALARAERLRAGHQTPPAAVRTALDRAVAAEDRGRIDEAVALYTVALREAIAAQQGLRIDRDIAQSVLATAEHLPDRPAVPQDARKRFAAGEKLLRQSQDGAGAEKAVADYVAAIGAAPWWPEAYAGLSRAEELRGDTVEAAAALALFVIAAPEAPGAQAALARIHALRAQGK